MYLFLDIIKAIEVAPDQLYQQHHIPLPEKHRNFVDVNHVDVRNKGNTISLLSRNKKNMIRAITINHTSHTTSV
jgi:hypothetical protein